MLTLCRARRNGNLKGNLKSENYNEGKLLVKVKWTQTKKGRRHFLPVSNQLNTDTQHHWQHLLPLWVRLEQDLQSKTKKLACEQALLGFISEASRERTGAGVSSPSLSPARNKSRAVSQSRARSQLSCRLQENPQLYCYLWSQELATWTKFCFPDITLYLVRRLRE